MNKIKEKIKKELIVFVETMHIRNPIKSAKIFANVNVQENVIISLVVASQQTEFIEFVEVNNNSLKDKVRKFIVLLTG